MVDTEGRADPMRSEAVRLRDGRTATIRPATEGDAAALQATINAIGAEIDFILIESVGEDLEHEREWIRGFDGTSSVLFVAEVDGKLAGQADVHPGRPPKESHVGTLGIAIQRGYRDVGLGRALMERCLEWMRDRQFKKACLQVFSTNARAIALYEKLGFRIEGVRPRQYRIRGEWVDDVMMGKWLE
jgi:ribosomal protein S18 acetylase RimI-like enzyme